MSSVICHLISISQAVSGRILFGPVARHRLVLVLLYLSLLVYVSFLKMIKKLCVLFTMDYCCQVQKSLSLSQLEHLRFKQIILFTFGNIAFSYCFREKLNSMNLLMYMSPIAVLVLLPATLVMEPDVLEVTLSLGLEHKLMWVLPSVNSAAAYLSNLSNFLVTKHTSALTLQV